MGGDMGDPVYWLKWGGRGSSTLKNKARETTKRQCINSVPQVQRRGSPNLCGGPQNCVTNWGCMVTGDALSPAERTSGKQRGGAEGKQKGPSGLLKEYMRGTEPRGLKKLSVLLQK